MIENLTAEQEEKFGEYVDKWTSIGLQARKTTDEDLKKAENLFIKLYKQEGLKKPKIYWEKSPSAAMLKKIELGDNSIGVGSNVSYGSHSAYWLSGYDYFREVVGLKKETEDILCFVELAKICGWFWTYEDAVIASYLPTELHRNENGDLHNFNGPAIAWEDGEAMYFFNGVAVKKEYALKSEFTKEEIVGETNADVRAQILLKIGINKVVDVLGALVEDEKELKTGGKYQLLMIDPLNTRNMLPYLKMKNPSVEIDHIEGVIGKTVEEALCFRNGLKKWVEPEDLS